MIRRIFPCLPGRQTLLIKRHSFGRAFIILVGAQLPFCVAQFLSFVPVPLVDTFGFEIRHLLFQVYFPFVFPVAWLAVLFAVPFACLSFFTMTMLPLLGGVTYAVIAAALWSRVMRAQV